MWDKYYLCPTKHLIMQTQFKNLTQLLDFFKDEETCRAYYEQQRWAGNVACPHCGSIKVYRTNRGFKCGEKVCAKKFSLTVGTIFENSKIGLRTWFAAMYLTTTSKKGISSLQLAEQLGLTQKTAWFVLSRIRTMLADNSTEPLDGMVEVDETYIGGKQKNKSKKVRYAAKKEAMYGKGTGPFKDKSPIVGILQRNGNVRLFPMVVADRATLIPLVTGNVSPNAEVVTDGHQAYRNLKDVFKLHVVVEHANDEWTKGKYSTNTIEGFWAIMKRGIYGIYHNISTKHTGLYCNEFGYRYNNRELAGIERFEGAVKKVCEARITYKTLIGK